MEPLRVLLDDSTVGGELPPALGALYGGGLALPPDEPQCRTPWMVAGAVLLIALAAWVPSQYKSAHHELANLERQQHIEHDLVALVHNRAITLRCGPVGVPNHAPVPLLALYLKTSPVNVINGQVARLTHGVYVDPASKAVEERYVLDPRDLTVHRPAPVRDVPYLPTEEPVVQAMLRLANVTANDIVYDLGCGDGRICIAAAKRFTFRSAMRTPEQKPYLAARLITMSQRSTQGDTRTFCGRYESTLSELEV